MPSSAFWYFLLTTILTRGGFLEPLPFSVLLMSSNTLMTLSHSRAASNPVRVAQLNGSLVLLDLHGGHGVDPGAVQGLGCVLSSCKRARS